MTEILIHCDVCNSNIWYDIEKLPMIECPSCKEMFRIHEEMYKRFKGKSDVVKEWAKENNIPVVEIPMAGDNTAK